MLPLRTSILSANTPNSGLTNRVGKKFRKATSPTKPADPVISQASQPMMTRCAQKPLSARCRLTT